MIRKGQAYGSEGRSIAPFHFRSVRGDELNCRSSISSAQIFASTTNLQHCRQSTMSTPKKSRNENEKRFQAEIAKKEKKLKRKSKQ